MYFTKIYFQQQTELSVLKITKISGNIFDDDELQKRFEKLDKQGKCERLKITRQELEKTRLRKNTDKGTDVGLLFNDSTKLNHGDVLISEDIKHLEMKVEERVFVPRKGMDVHEH